MKGSFRNAEGALMEDVSGTERQYKRKYLFF